MTNPTVATVTPVHLGKCSSYPKASSALRHHHRSSRTPILLQSTGNCSRTILFL